MANKKQTTQFNNCYCIDDYADELRRELKRLELTWTQEMIDDLPESEQSQHYVGEDLVKCEYGEKERMRRRIMATIFSLEGASCYLSAIDGVLSGRIDANQFDVELASSLHDTTERSKNGLLYEWPYEVM